MYDVLLLYSVKALKGKIVQKVNGLIRNTQYFSGTGV